MNNLIAGHLRFEQVKGVGTIDINFAKDKQAYVLIGENGVGKTKFLESLFAVLLITNHQILKGGYAIPIKKLPFSYIQVNDNILNRNKMIQGSVLKKETFKSFFTNPYPIVYISASSRSDTKKNNHTISEIGNTQDRNKRYLDYLMSCFKTPDIYCFEAIKHLNMDIDLSEWIIQRAQSANKYQAKEDNREIEINTLLTLLNKIDNRIDSEFLQISGDNRVFIKIEGQKRELSELSSGFTSILKMLQAIIAGYSYFTNEVQIQNVRGFVLIDEIESHLHNEWQVNIVPLLKESFPNTTFVVTTHSSLVISQLEQGEAYRLQRDNDGVVYGKEIDNPNKIPFIDLLQNAFDINLNQLKINRVNSYEQEEAKKELLAFIEKELAELETDNE